MGVSKRPFGLYRGVSKIPFFCIGRSGKCHFLYRGVWKIFKWNSIYNKNVFNTCIHLHLTSQLCFIEVKFKISKINGIGKYWYVYIYGVVQLYIYSYIYISLLVTNHVIPLHNLLTQSQKNRYNSFLREKSRIHISLEYYKILSVTTLQVCFWGQGI